MDKEQAAIERLKMGAQASEVFRDELIWYYTEYRSRLDEKRTEAET